MLQKTSQKKQIVILRHNGGQLGNQLLLFISIYAYCLEKGYECKNYAFYEYNKYFNFYELNIFIRFFAFISSLNFYKSHVITYIFYKLWTNFVPFISNGKILREDRDKTFCLPPTQIKDKLHLKIIKDLEESTQKRFYINGWNFRNPSGLTKYYDQIITIFKPKKEIILRVDNFIQKIKADNFLIGVHIRQGEYKSKNFMGGKWYYNELEVADILKTYLKRECKKNKKALFILCSDGPIDLSFFSGLNVKLGIGSMMEDLITLSMCNKIIGSNSTFGSFAAYFGKIPFFIFDRKKKYIQGKGVNLFQY